MKVNHIEVANFLRGKYAFNTTRENKILAKISEFTVSMWCYQLDTEHDFGRWHF